MGLCLVPIHSQDWTKRVQDRRMWPLLSVSCVWQAEMHWTQKARQLPASAPQLVSTIDWHGSWEAVSRPYNMRRNVSECSP
jgi:hypothetical protein